MAAAVGPLRLAGGAARNLARTARSMAYDLAGGAARGTEALSDRIGGRRRTPGTLRVDVLILADEAGVPLVPAEALRPALDRAASVLATEAGLRLRVTSVRTAEGPAPTETLDPRANRELLLDDIAGRTAFFRAQLPETDGAAVGSPITVVVVRSILGRITGCSLGLTADWVIVQASLFDQANPHTYDETVLAHELGHALNLPHSKDPTNLMFPASSPPDDLRGTELRGWQIAVAQANRHVVPGIPSR